MRLIHVTPGLPPSVGGVADYVANLARRLALHKCEDQAFVVCDPGWAGHVDDLEFPCTQITGSSDALVDALNDFSTAGNCAILLQYVGYGYDRRGAPIWLPPALETFR